MVAGCDQQDRALYEDEASPTASINVIFRVLTVAAAENKYVITMDIVGAYLINFISSGAYVLRASSSNYVMWASVGGQGICHDR